MMSVGVGVGLLGPQVVRGHRVNDEADDLFRIGIIGLDTSQVTMISTHINDYGENWDAIARSWGPELEGYRVVAAYPYGSRTIESSVNQIPLYVERMKEMGVEVVDSLSDLLDRVDGVLLMTFDGHARLEQSIQVIEAGKRLFVNKPFAAGLSDVVRIMDLANARGVELFSSSPTRYLKGAQAARSGEFGDIVGAATYSGAPMEPSHTDFYWYGIHGIEILFTIMGKECESVRRVSTSHTDIVIGHWDEERLGVYRGIRRGSRTHSGTVFGSTGIHTAGDFSEVGHRPLVVDILRFFRSGKTPVPMEETLAMHAYMEAADSSRDRNGAAVSLQEVLDRARS